MPEKMLVLASSRKLGGRCIAGVSLQSGRLIRPVSRGGGAEGLTPVDTGLAPAPREFDVVSFGHEGWDGDVTQPENLVIDGSPWVNEGPIDLASIPQQIDPLISTEPLVFGNKGKAVHVDDTADGVPESLCVIEPQAVAFEYTATYKTRAQFKHGGRNWDLGLTDYPVSNAVRARGPGMYTLEQLGFGSPSRTLLLLSLGLPYGEFHHKLVAAVLPLP